MTEARLIEIAKEASEPLSAELRPRSLRPIAEAQRRTILLLVGEVFWLRSLIVRQREAA